MRLRDHAQGVSEENGHCHLCHEARADSKEAPLRRGGSPRQRSGSAHAEDGHRARIPLGSRCARRFRVLKARAGASSSRRAHCLRPWSGH